MKPSPRLPSLVLASLALAPAVLTAADVFKANNTSALNLGASWTGGSAPGSGDVAVWDGTVSAANSAALGTSQSWQGIRIANPVGAITVTHAAGNVLTLGSSGMDLSAATQNLTVLGTANTACDLAVAAPQTWTVASGRTLALLGTSNSQNQRLTGSSTIEITGAGIVRMLVGDLGSTTTAAGNGNDTFTGNWTITNGSVRTLRNGTHAWGQGTITLNGGTIGQEQGNWMWNNNIILNTGTTSAFDDFNTSQTTRTLKLMGVVSGSGNLNFNDSSGRSGNDTGYVLTGANTLGGTVTLGTGADVRVGGVPTLNDLTTTSGTGGTLGTAVVNLSSPTSVLTISRSDNFTFANVVSGSGVLRIGVTTAAQNTGITTVSGGNTHSGGTMIQSAATLKIGHANALGSGPVIINGNGSFDNGTGSTLSVANALTLSGGSPVFLGSNDLTFGGAVSLAGANRSLTVNAGTLTLAGAISQDASPRNLTKQGAGSLVLSGANSITGSVVASAGTVTVTGSSTTAGATVSGGTLVLDYGTTDASKIGDTATLTLGNGSLVLAGATGSHTETVGSTLLNGTATLSRSGANTVKIALGAITRNAGATLGIASENLATTTSANVNGILPGVTIGGTSLAANDGSGNIVAASSGLTEVTRLESGAKTIAGNTASNIRIVDGTGSAPADITLAAAGTTDIANLFNGATGGPSVLDIGSGNTLRLGAFAFLSSETGTSAFTVANGTLTAGGADNTAGDVILANTGSSETTVSSALGNNGTGAVSLTKNGSGPATLAGSNSFTGNLTVNAGTLTLSGGSAVADAVGVSLANTAGTSLKLNSPETIGGLSGGGATGGNVNLNGQTLTVAPPAAHSNFNGAINGAGTLAKAGANQLRLGGAIGAAAASSTFSALQVDAGLVIFTSTAADDGLPSVTINGDAASGIVLGDVFTGGKMNIGALSGTGGKIRADWNTPTGQRTLSVTQSTNTTFAGVFEDATTGSRSVGLEKNGSGTLALSGLSTCTGSFTVNSGTLAASSGTALGSGPVTVNGGSLNLGGQTLANTVSVGASGSLTGSGTLSGATVLNGTLTPGGSSLGLVSLGAVTVGPTAVLVFQLDDATSRGVEYDALNVAGALALDGTITVTLGALVPAAGQHFDLINSAGAIDLTHFNLATDLVLPALSGGLAWDTAAFASDGVISIVSSSPFASWQGSRFTAPELANPLVSGQDADPDGDGLSNALEYAFGSEPKSGDNANRRPQASVSGGALALAYRRPVGGASGVTYTVQVLDNVDLVSGNGNWAAAIPVTDYAESAPVSNGDGTETVSITFTGTVSGRKFARIFVSF